MSESEAVRFNYANSSMARVGIRYLFSDIKALVRLILLEVVKLLLRRMRP